jgi:hypothetical protein
MQRGIVAALALSMMLVASCSSSESNDQSEFPCDTAKSKCANDPPFDPDDCKKIVGDAQCGRVFVDFLLCAGLHSTSGLPVRRDDRPERDRARVRTATGCGNVMRRYRRRPRLIGAGAP